MKAGVLLLDKPAGLSSAKAIAIAKGRLRLKKIGHAGTLDPPATGLLITLVGSATRLAQYAGAGDKEYQGTIRLGVVTDTDDIAGKVLTESAEIPEFAAVARTAAGLVGELQQVPPQVSAVKVNGVRGYELARKGIESELAARPVRVDCFEVSPVPGCDRQVAFRICCSKGTYVRSLARDLGAALGCGACVATLRRTASLPFTIAQAHPLDDLTPEDVLDWSVLFPAAERLQLSREESRRLQGGDERALLNLRGDLGNATQAIYGCGDSPEWLGLLVRENGAWRFGVNLG